MKTFALVSQSASVVQAELGALAAALEIQLNRDFAPAWTPDEQYRVTASPARDLGSPTQADCVCTFTDHVDDPSAEAYHSAVGDAPFIVIEVPDCPDGISVPTSHELLETCADWSADLWSPGPADLFGAATQDIAREVCDPVEDETYLVNGIALSNFALPAYFLAGSSGPWDFCGGLSGPLELSSGGYWARRDGSVLWGSPEREARGLRPWRRGARRVAAVPGQQR